MEYNANEIHQLRKAIHQFFTRTSREVDMRQFRSSNVKWFMNITGMIFENEDGRFEFSEPLRLRNQKGPLWSKMPIELIWDILKDAIIENTSYRILNSRAWHELNLDTQEFAEKVDAEHANKIKREKVFILEMLAQAGYIKLQMAGSLWVITVLK